MDTPSDLREVKALLVDHLLSPGRSIISEDDTVLLTPRGDQDIIVSVRDPKYSVLHL